MAYVKRRKPLRIWKPKWADRGKYTRTPEILAKQSIAVTAIQKKRVESGENNLTWQDTCKVCGETMQFNMIKRWHNEKCKKLKNTWSYRSRKLPPL